MGSGMRLLYKAATEAWEEQVQCCVLFWRGFCRGRGVAVAEAEAEAWEGTICCFCFGAVGVGGCFICLVLFWHEGCTVGVGSGGGRGMGSATKQRWQMCFGFCFGVEVRRRCGPG